MNNKKILLLTVLILNLLVMGTVSASGANNGNAAAADQDTIKASGNSYAILVGVSTYQNPSTGNLDSVLQDIPHIKNMLLNNCDYSSSRITTLQDSQATKSAIKSALAQMSSRVGPDDIVVFYFSGHGFLNSGGSAYILPYDSGEQYSYSTYISSSEMKQWLDGIKCRNVLVIIDACYSEGMLKEGTKDLGNVSQVTAGNDNISNADRFSQNFLGTFGSRSILTQSPVEQQKALTGKKYVALAACRSNELSRGDRTLGGAFTEGFVTGMGQASSDTNNDNWVSAEEAFNYASVYATWIDSNQHPVMYDGDPSHDLQMASFGTAGLGTIDIKSSPAGAKIFLDGADTKLTTPKALSGVTAGTHTIRCSLSGYNDQSQGVNVAAGKTSSISLTLQKQSSSTGSISVSSSPSGAAIFLDDQNTGKSSPTTITGVTAGSHTIRCSISGYNDKSQGVNVAAGKTSSISLTLQKQSSSTGSISVSSSPSGAAIFLDDQNTGKSSPTTITGVSAGTHTIRCSLSGYNDQSQGVNVAAGKTSSISLTLQKQSSSTGSISVSSSPSGARIYLDGTDTGKSTPNTITGVTTGTHTIGCSLSGYNDKSQGVNVAAGKTSSISLTLQKQSSSTGSISVSSSPSGAAIFLDDQNTGKSTPNTITGVTAGTHTIRCVYYGYNDQSQGVNVAAGKTSSISLTLQKQSSSTGSISVSSSPSGARIYLDGTDTGKSTPNTITGVTTGTHTIGCSLSGYNDKSQGVNVAAGKTSSISLTLQKQSSSTGSISVSSSPSGAAIFLDDQNTGKSTPNTITGVTAGTHTIRCVYYGYNDQSQVVNVATGKTSSISLNLQKQNPSIDPIIGIWRYYQSNLDDKYQFYADGSFLEHFISNKYPSRINSVSTGTWSAQGGNSYTLRKTDGTIYTMIYNPTQNAIYDTRYPALLLTPYQGDVMKGQVLSGGNQAELGISES